MDEIISLASLIKADKGVLQPLLVRKIDTDLYEIIAGHKRRRACKYLVEVEGEKEYEFIPCIVETLSDVKAEFQLYSSNGFHTKTEYEIMHELERMKFLLENYPEEFPHLQTGRMVERLAKQLNMKKTTVGEYLTISKNLGDKGKEKFKNGELKKSAALEISSLDKNEQDKLLDSGMISQREIKEYKGAKAEKIKPGKTKSDPVTQPLVIPEAVQEEMPGQCKIIDTDMNIEEETEVVSDPPVEYTGEAVEHSVVLDQEEPVTESAAEKIINILKEESETLSDEAIHIIADRIVQELQLIV